MKPQRPKNSKTRVKIIDKLVNEEPARVKKPSKFHSLLTKFFKEEKVVNFEYDWKYKYVKHIKSFFLKSLLVVVYSYFYMRILNLFGYKPTPDLFASSVALYFLIEYTWDKIITINKGKK